MHKSGVTIRAGGEDDVSFIYSTWLRGLYHGNSWFKKIDKDSYFDIYAKIINRLLSTSVVRVACLSDEPDVVLGYSVSARDTLHWVFVKKAWRQMGIAKALIPPAINRCTHLTRIGDSLKPKDWKFIPFFI